MGVHLTFVRSLDLDEWTQRQIDAMRIGGNGNARIFFRKHGFTDLHGGKAEKKYKCKAAVSYRTELAKLVEAEAAKRGEATAALAEVETKSEGSLLDNLDDVMKKQQDDEARRKIDEARGGGPSGVLHAVQRKASDLEGAKGRLQVTPPNSGQLKLKTETLARDSSGKTGSRLVLRKPSSGAGVKMMKKKSSGVVANKLRVNKLNMSSGASGNGKDDEGFEDVAETQNKIAEAEKEAKQKKDEEIALKLQEELDMGADTTTNGNAALKTLSPASVEDKARDLSSPSKKGTNMEQNLNRLKNMTGDFFSGI